MRRSAALRQLQPEQRCAVDKCANYLLNHRAFFKYDDYLAAGFPIATGIIEGACRHLIKDRMDITGARWILDVAEAVLRLRSFKVRSQMSSEEYQDWDNSQVMHRGTLYDYTKYQRIALRLRVVDCQ